MKIIFSSNIAWSIYMFRGSLLQQLQKEGHKIDTVAQNDNYSQKLENMGFTFVPIEINNNSKNPISVTFITNNNYSNSYL